MLTLPHFQLPACKSKITLKKLTLSPNILFDSISAPTTKVSQLYQFFSSNLGIPTCSFYLMIGPKVLQPQYPLLHYGYQKLSDVTVKFRLLGGAPPKKKVSDYTDAQAYLQTFKADFLKDIARGFGATSLPKKQNAIDVILAQSLNDLALEMIIESKLAIFAATTTTSSSASTFIPVKLPKYEPNNVRAWLKHCEIVSPTYHHNEVFGKIPTDVVSRLSPDDYTKCTSYEELQNILLPKVEDSVEESLRKLLEHQELGDRKPTIFLEHLQDLATRASQDPESILIRQKFIDNMPSEIRIPLAALVSSPLKELAEAADKMYSTLKPTTSSKYCVSNIQNSKIDIDAIVSQVSNRLNLNRSSNKFNSNKSHNKNNSFHNNRNRYNNYNHYNSHSRRNSRSPSANRSLSNYKTNRSNNNNHNNAICYFHSKFGSKAYKCNKPCGFNSLIANKNSSAKSSRDSSPNVASCVFSVPFNIDNCDDEIKFMIDSGSSYSILPEDLVPKNVARKSIRVKIAGWNGQSHIVNESISLLLCLKGQSQRFTQNFLIAPSLHPILGADFCINITLPLMFRVRD